jgi:hypothetical protein
MSAAVNSCWLITEDRSERPFVTAATEPARSRRTVRVRGVVLAAKKFAVTPLDGIVQAVLV